MDPPIHPPDDRAGRLVASGAGPPGGGHDRGRQHPGLGVGSPVGRAAPCLTRWCRRGGSAHRPRRIGRRVVVRRGRERARALDGVAVRRRRRPAPLPRLPRRMDDGSLSDRRGCRGRARDGRGLSGLRRPSGTNPRASSTGTRSPPGWGASGRKAAAVCRPTARSSASITPNTATSTGRPSGSWTADPVRAAGDQVDPELRMEAVAWSPAPGARRLLFTQERAGIERPGGLGPRHAGARGPPMDEVDGPGDPAGMDARRRPPPRAQRSRRKASIGSSRWIRRRDRSRRSASLEGTIHEAGFRPDGELWFRGDSSVEPPSVRDAGGRDGPRAADRSPAARHPQPLALVEQPRRRRHQRVPHNARRIRARSRRSRRSTEGPSGTTPICGIPRCRRSSTRGSRSSRPTTGDPRVAARRSVRS